METAYNWVVSPITLTFPEYKKGEPQTCARWIINKISEHNHKEGIYYFLLTRVEVVSFPIFLALSIVQKGGVVIEAIFNATVWHQGNHKSLAEETKELLCLIGTLFYEVVMIVPSVIYPTFLERPAPGDADPTPQEKIDEKTKEIETLKNDHAKALEEKTKSVAELEKTAEQKAEELTELQNKHSQELEEKTREIETLKNDHAKALEEKTKSVTELEKTAEQKAKKLTELQNKHSQELEEKTTEIETLKNDHAKALEEKIKSVTELEKTAEQKAKELTDLQNKHSQELEEKTTEIENLRSNHRKALEEKTKSVAELEKTVEQKAEELTDLQNKHSQELKGKTTEIENLQAGILELKKLQLQLQEGMEAANAQADSSDKKLRSYIYENMPLINKGNIKDCQIYLKVHNIPGLSISQVRYEEGEDPDSKTWGMDMAPGTPESKLKEEQGEKYQTPFKKLQSAKFKVNNSAVSDPNKFLRPEGTTEMVVKGNQEVLKKTHLIDRLVYEEFSEDFPMEKGGVLSKIHTLVLKGTQEISIKKLEEIAKTFPNIACFDLSEIKVEGDLVTFKKKHIVLLPKENNIRTMFDELDEKLFNLVKGYNDQFYLQFKSSDDLDSLFHPAAPFITNIAFLRGLPMRESIFKALAPRLKCSFPNIRTLNLSKCERLTTNTLEDIAKLGIKKLFMLDCPMLPYSRVAKVSKEIEFETNKASTEGWNYGIPKLTIEPSNKPTEEDINQTGSVYYKNPRFSDPEFLGISKNNQYYPLSEAQIEKKLRYRLFVDGDKQQRTYYPSKYALNSALNRLFESGCNEVNLIHTPVKQKSIEEVVLNTIDRCEKERGEEVKLTYTTQEGETLEYPFKK